MRGEEQPPELSVIIPTLNEAATLPPLLGDLAAQQRVRCEVLISDGGSSDGTTQLAVDLLARHRLVGTVFTGQPGRGRQLNRAAELAMGDWLLFMHADSRLPQVTALTESLKLLRSADLPHLSGRFTVHFDVPDGERHFGYYLCEVKARSGLPGTIHGDQGFWLSRRFFAELGGFREDLPALEDTLLAEAIRSRGQWYLLPANILTSPRRFKAEGYRQRQTLNALMMNFALIGWDEPLLRYPSCYNAQDRTGPLQLAPFYRLIDRLLLDMPRLARLRVWYRTGCFVRDNAWQLALRRTANRAYTAGKPANMVSLTPIDRFRSWFEPLTDHFFGHLAAALLAWLWFRTRKRSPQSGA